MKRGTSDACHSPWPTPFTAGPYPMRRMPFFRGLEKVSFKKGKIPVFSNTTGKKYPAAPASARKLLAYQLAKPVDFVSVIENMYGEGVRTFVEVGPNAVLKGLVGAILGSREQSRPHVCLAVDKASSKESGIVGFARVLAHLSAAGHAVDLTPWNRNLKEPAVLGKPKMTVPISGVNHVAEREPTPPKAKTIEIKELETKGARNQGHHLFPTRRNGWVTPLSTP